MKPDTPVKKTRKTGAPDTETETFTFRRSHVYAVLVVLAFAAGLLLGYVAWGRETSAAAGAPAPVVAAPTPTEARQVTRYEVESEGFPSIGPADAPIVLVEFSDYQCPFCTRWHNEVFEPLMAAYPGQIRLVYRHLPLTSIHPDAFSAAEAALCAGEQNSYWEFHNALFEARYGLGQAAYIQYATDLGLDLNAFTECLQSDRQEQAVRADMEAAVNLGINGTPTFFLNGLRIVGAMPLDYFKQVVDMELAGEIPR